ncbi:cytokine receptor family member b1 [Solea solea]|uniref:cytokine receptor family member b1 n=1 Tax=Solea solea TaxID=90069 RepID=UPI00272C4316|nr:cytokine receptor family member b1 [Solea solea]XP_058479378.1 cytokine receptor family member b1 [Solea solea]
MHCLALTCIMLLLNSVLATLPAPCNTSVVSVNFHHILRWDPGPGTPPGTKYIISKRLYGQKRNVRVNVTTSTSIQLKLHSTMRYRLTVQASFNQSLSLESSLVFCPYEDTKIGPPVLSLAGCGDCIEINISLPEADRSSGINDMHKFYSPQFRILYRGKETLVDFLTKKLNNIIISNLDTGVEYCVQVQTKIIVNKNTEPSAWKCIYTSIIEPHREPVVLGAGAALLILVLGGLTACIFCLHYTGFLCTLKTLPRAIIIVSKGYILTPDGTTPDPISISSEMVKQRSQNISTILHTASEDEEEEEEVEEEAGGEIIDYMDRDAQLSLRQSLCWSSSTVTEKSEPAASGESGSLRERLIAVEAEFDGGVTHGGQDEDEASAFMPKETQTEVQVGEEEQEEKRQNDNMFDSASNVNLFSVTIAALSVGEEDEQNKRELLSNLVKQTETQKQALSNTDSQSDTAASVQSSNEDCTKSWYENNDTDIKTSNTEHEPADEVEEDHEDDEEEEDDEEDEDADFSGYMAHT